MAMSFGQHMSDGKSHGPFGHGGIHRMGGHGATVGSPHSNPHTMGNEIKTGSNGGIHNLGC